MDMGYDTGLAYCSSCPDFIDIPRMNRRFVDTFLDWHARPPSRYRVAERQLFQCAKSRRGNRARRD